MTTLQNFIVGIIGEMPAGLEFLLPLFSYGILCFGLLLVTILFITFFKIIRG